MHKLLRQCLLFLLAGLFLLACPAQAASRPHIRTREELAAYLRACAYACESKPSFTYDAVLASRIKDKSWISDVIQENGISHASWSYDAKSLTFTEVTYCEEFYHQKETPVYWLSSLSEISDFLKSMALERKTEYTFFYDAALGFYDNPEKLRSLVFPAGVENYSHSTSLCRIHISNVVYPDVFAFCETEDDVRTAMEGYAKKGVQAYSLFCSQALFQQLSRNNFSRVHALEAQVRMQSHSMSYSTQSWELIYSSIVYARDARQCTSIAEAQQTLCEGAEQLQLEITLFCTPEVYRSLSKNNLSLLGTLAGHAGIKHYHYSIQESGSKISISNIVYRPGFKILTAYRTKRLSLLTGREYDTLSRAADILNTAGRPSDYLGAEKWIHDYLCKAIVYTIDDSTDEDDNAIGALLRGEANCDGYADAFYLLGNLIGLEVGYQTGKSRSANTENHAWNTIRIQDEWYLVDVTWNDSNTGDWNYVWYNVGADIAGYTHSWDETQSPYLLAAATQNAYRPRPIYSVRTLQQLTSAIAACRGAGSRDVDIFYGAGVDLSRQTEDMYEAVRSGGATGTIYSNMYQESGAVSFTSLQFE